MASSFKHFATLAISILLFNCAASNQSPEQAPQSQKLQQEDKAQTLSNYQSTTIQTSNGPITITPTVIAPTDKALNSEDEPLEIVRSDYSDPLEFINRPIFTFNHYSYKYALIPLSNGYKALLPQPVRTSIGSLFDNIREPLNLINNAVSLEFSEAGNNFGRFVINSTVGILGLFDPASAWFGIEKKPQNIAQTLIKYNVGSGAYLVLPILGQSDIRGAASIVGESFIHPINYVLDSPENTIARAVDGFDDFSKQADTYEKLFEQATDPYIYFRNQYIQSTNRDELSQKRSNSEVNLGGGATNE